MPADVVCFSHLPWDHVFQRPHQLMTRAARHHRVVVVEQPVPGRRPATVELHRGPITVLRPVLPQHLDRAARHRALADLLAEALDRRGVRRPWRWYYDPLQIAWSDGIEASAVVYDCMDELSAFRGAPRDLGDRERQLMTAADVMFTGGRRLFEARRLRHPDIHCVPSAVDIGHFRRARDGGPEPADQVGIPSPRIGWFGVVDERMDLALLAAVAARRPEWSFVLVGPIAKLTPADLPRAANLHWLGQRPYADLPAYLAGWDVAIMPFARNAATAYISPTKTPEYLAGGRPVVSTPITDVVRPYGDLGLVRIASTADAFESAIAAALVEDRGPAIAAADRFLAGMSWDRTWREMERLTERAARRRAMQAPAGAAAPSRRLATPATARVQVAGVHE